MKKMVLSGVVIIGILSLSACRMTDEIPLLQEMEESTSEEQWPEVFTDEELLKPAPAEGYFFPQGTASHIYMAAFVDFFPQQQEEEVVLCIMEVQVFEGGTLYELKIDSDIEAPDTHAGYRGDWRDFGLFYVQGDEIYFIRAEEAKSEYQTAEEIINDGTKVCSETGEEDPLDEDERGWHEFILADGDRREYHGYSTLVETGYYEHFFWEKGKGLVQYESGYGALANGIEMYLVEIEETENQHIESQETIETDSLSWIEITDDGVNEKLFLENLDTEVLAAVATELQTLVDEEVEAERANPEIVITEGWTRVFKSPQYEKVLNMGESAMKPLYWIIYKSPDAGMYEYICATALYELSGYDFTYEDGSLTWNNSKEFLDRFNERILGDRKG